MNKSISLDLHYCFSVVDLNELKGQQGRLFISEKEYCNP